MQPSVRKPPAVRGLLLAGIGALVLIGPTSDTILPTTAASEHPLLFPIPGIEPGAAPRGKDADQKKTSVGSRPERGSGLQFDPLLGPVPLYPGLIDPDRRSPSGVAVAVATEPSPRREPVLDDGPMPEVKGLAVRKVAEEHRKEKKDFAPLLAAAEKAIKKDDKEIGGHYLKGLALLSLSRDDKDHAARLKKLEDARAALADAAKLLKAGDDPTELSHFHRVWSSACLEHAMYSPNRSGQQDVFRDAEKHARKAVDLDGKNREAWEALAYAQASAAFILKEPDRYKAALEAYDKGLDGMEMNPDRCQLWVGRGRCRFRMAALDADAKGFDAAEADLKAVASHEKTKDRIDAAEALYHLALIARERRSILEKDGGAGSAQKRAQLVADEEKAIEQALKVARAARDEVWEEYALRGWITLAVSEAAARKRDGKADARQWLDRVRDLARQLQPINPVEALMARVQAASIAGQSADEVLALLKDVPARSRLQDEASMANLLILRGHYHLSVRPADLDAAAKDAEEAERLMGRTDVDPSARVVLHGLEGVVKLLAGDARPAERARMRAEAIGHFREAVRMSPDHPHNWFWRWLQARLLWLKEERTAEERQEAERRITEARDRVPSSAPRPYRDALEATYRMIVER